MVQPDEDAEPIRNREGVVVYPSFQDRPNPDFILDSFHRALLLVSLLLAIGLPIYFLLWSFGVSGVLPMQYSFSGEVTREGSTVEGAVTLAVLGATTIGVAVLARYPRVYNFPVTLTEHNVQRQYLNAVQMMCWLAASMVMTMAIMVGSWLGVISAGWNWLPMVLIGGSMIFFITRMFRLR